MCRSKWSKCVRNVKQNQHLMKRNVHQAHSIELNPGIILTWRSFERASLHHVHVRSHEKNADLRKEKNKSISNGATDDSKSTLLMLMKRVYTHCTGRMWVFIGGYIEYIFEQSTDVEGERCKKALCPWPDKLTEWKRSIMHTTRSDYISRQIYFQ